MSDWHIVTVAYSQSTDTVKFYVDGVLDNSATGIYQGDYSVEVARTNHNGIVDVDWVFVAKLADPADFGTPQILEF